MADEKDERTQAQIDADTEAAEYLGVEVVNGQAVPPAEDKPAEEPAPTSPPTPQEEQPAPPPPAPIDHKALAEEVASRTASELAAKLAPKKEEKADLSPWAKEGRTPADYDEIYTAAVTRAKEETMAELRAEQEAQLKAYQEQQTQAQQAQQAQILKFGQEFDQDIAILENTGRLPKVVDAQSDTDPGKLARIDLLTQMQSAIQPYLDKGLDAPSELMSASKFYLAHYKPTTSQEIPGADAPIGLGHAPANSDSDVWPSYEEIHSTKFGDLANLVKSKLSRT